MPEWIRNQRRRAEEEVSILYLRCTDMAVTATPVLNKMPVSILYLRCITYEWVTPPWAGGEFVSILYLRCTDPPPFFFLDRYFLAFQFSI